MWSLFSGVEENWLTIPLLTGCWIIGVVEVVIVVVENCGVVFLVLLDTDGEAITIEEMREISFLIAEWAIELVTSSLIWLESVTAVVGDPVEMFEMTVVENALVWVGRSVVPNCVLPAL